MRGHVRKRGNSWSVVYDEGRDETGRRVQRWRGGFATKREAEEALTSILDTLRTGSYIKPSSDTFGSFLDAWLAAVEPQLRPTTFASYRMLVGRYIKPRLGRVKLQRLTAMQINTAYADLLREGYLHSKKPRGLSARSVRHCHMVIRKALGDAVAWNLLPRNVADAANPPKKQTKRKPTWMAEQLRTFLAHVAEDRLYAAYLLAATTGMRRGEILGLGWPDLDLDGARLTVSRSLVCVEYEPRMSEPKTARGRRVVALDPMTVQALRDHQARQLDERLAMGGDWGNDLDLVFTREDGTPLHPQRFSDGFDQRVKASGLPRLSLHGLRHTHATLALRAGVHPKVVSERLGHASVAFTMDVYTDALPDLQEGAPRWSPRSCSPSPRKPHPKSAASSTPNRSRLPSINQVSRSAMVALLLVAIAAGSAQSAERLPTLYTAWRGFQVRPTVVVYTGDATGILEHLHWSSWTGSAAIGKGADVVRSCTPDCATGQTRRFPVLVRAWRPVRGRFTRLTMQYHGKPANTIYLCGRSWGLPPFC